MASGLTQRATVLVVDDIPENIDVLRGVLTDEYEVKVATNGVKALAIAEADLPDLILLDVMMPGMDGFEVCRRLKERESTRDIPVLFVTALVERVKEEEGFRVGCVDYLTKPISPPLALARVRTHIALRQAQKELESWNCNLKGRVKSLSSLVVTRGQQLASVDTVTRSSREDWVDLVVRLLDMIEPDLAGHGRRVAAMAGEVAKALDLCAAELETIRVAALLHDIGKVGLEREVTVLRPERLPNGQKTIYLSHAVRGQLLLSQVEWLNGAGELIRHHHEQMNGSGGPDRLIGTEIPLGSRIIAIADYIDRTVSHAKYGLTLHETLRGLGIQAGRSFDKELIPLFNEIAPRVLDPTLPGSQQTLMVPVTQLAPGMVMAEDLHSGSLILLAEHRERISAKTMQQIKRALHLDAPTSRNVLVCKPTA